jgi:hypothetical protein
MFLAPVAVLVGLLLAQLPAGPSVPPRADDPAATSALIAPELRNALDALERCSSCTFDVEGQRQLPFGISASIAQVASMARAATARSWFDGIKGIGQRTTVTGRFERDKPLFLTTASLEAFRSGQRLVYRTRGEESWTDWTNLLLRRASDESQLLKLLARLPSPGELLDALEARIEACERVSDPADETSVTWVCRLRPDGTVRSTLTLHLDRGALTRLEFEGRSSLRYRVRDVDATEVVVPEEAALLLQGR